VNTAFFLFVGVSTLLALRNWRLGILLMLFAGALQDPVRKLMPGAPGWMVLAFIPVLLGVMAHVFIRHPDIWRRLLRAMPVLRQSVAFFALSLVLAFLVLVVNYGLGAWMVGVIGLVTYLFPVLAIALGYFYVRSTRDLLRLMMVYCTLTAILLIGGLLEYLAVFPNWPAIGTEALDMYWFRNVPGYTVRLTSGFYRSPDFLGWNAALLVMFSLLLALHSKGFASRGLWSALAAWGIAVLLISGRNKMIFMPPVFAAVLGLSYLYKGNIGKVWSISLAVAVSAALFLGISQQMHIDQEYLDYVGVGTQTVGSRVGTGGVDSVIVTLRQSGFFGEGLGSASTGSRYGGSAERSDTWQESGPSKIMVELGVIGFVATIFLGFTILRILWRYLVRMPRSAPQGVLFVGFLGIFAANGASFLVSHQAFGDPFLVTLTGFLLGITLSGPRWAFSVPRRRPKFEHYTVAAA
jgi:hypothetical protein